MHWIQHIAHSSCHDAFIPRTAPYAQHTASHPQSSQTENAPKAQSAASRAQSFAPRAQHQALAVQAGSQAPQPVGAQPVSPDRQPRVNVSTIQRPLCALTEERKCPQGCALTGL